jgi:hypothetical protein
MHFPETIGFDALGILKLTDFTASSVLFVHDNETSQDKRAQDVKMVVVGIVHLTDTQ